MQLIDPYCVIRQSRTEAPQSENIQWVSACSKEIKNIPVLENRSWFKISYFSALFIGLGELWMLCYGAHTTQTNFRNVLSVQASSALLVYVIMLIVMRKNNIRNTPKQTNIFSQHWKAKSVFHDPKLISLGVHRKTWDFSVVFLLDAIGVKVELPALWGSFVFPLTMCFSWI